jgi:predicted Zn-dependent protease
MRKYLLTLFIIAVCLVSVSANPQSDEDVLIRALRAELARSMAELKLGDLEKPYFIELSVDDAELYSASAAFGGLTGAGRSRFRVFSPQVRVGGYDSDNTGFASFADSFRFGGAGNALVQEDDELALRRDMWLALDAVYKQAAQRYASKVAFLKNKVLEEKIPDFTKAEPVTSLAPRVSLTLDEARWAKAVKAWSAIFRRFPEINDSSVTLEARAGNRYLVNSEGTVIRRPFALYTVTAQAQAQAADGMNLAHSRPIYARSLEELPSDEEVARVVEQTAKELTALRNAPVFDGKYLGPVLFTGQAAGEFFAQMLAPNLSGERAPLIEENFVMSGGRLEFADRLNRPVMAKFLSAYDDPTQAMFGGYELDDQGVKGQRISLIENGVLRNLLMSRRPRKEFPQSNGHGRSTSIGAARGAVSNFFVRAQDGKSEDELKQELIKNCREIGLPFCVKITMLAPDQTPGGASLSPPVLAYKVYAADGREELVRGLSLGEVTLRALRDIIFAGRDNYVYNTALSGDFWRGGLPVSVNTPSIVVEEMEMKKVSGTQQKPALLTHPFFNKGKE